MAASADQRDRKRTSHGDAQSGEVAALQPIDERRVGLLDRPALEQRRGQRRDRRQREQQRAPQRERVRQRDGTEDAPLDPLEREDRHHRRADDRHREQRRPHHLLGGLGDDVGDALRRRLLERQVPVGVLDHDHRPLQQDAEVDRAHRQQIRRHPRVVEAHERGQQRERHHHRHRQRADHRAQKQPDDDADQRDPLDHVVRHRGQRRVDETGAVVERHDAHAGRQQLVVDLRHRLVQAAQHLLRVLPAAQQDGPFDRINRVGARHRPAARGVRLDHLRDGAHQDRRAARRLDHRVADVGGRLQIAAAAHHQLRLAELQVPARSRAVGRCDRVDHVLERDARVAQPARIGEHVPLLLEAAEADHVGDAGRAHQPLRHHPVLPAPQLAGRSPIALERVLVDLSDRRVVRPEVRRDALGHLGVGQPFGHLLACPVDVDVVLEGQDHLRQAERGDRALDQHARGAGQRALDRNRHLLLDLLRRLAGVEGDHHDLDVGDVRERLDFQLGEGDGAEQRQHQRHGERDRAAVNGEVDELVEHGGTGARGRPPTMCTRRARGGRRKITYLRALASQD